MKNFLTAYRRGLIKRLSDAGWTQQKIAESLNITQAAVSEHMKRDHRKYGDDAFNRIVQQTIDASLPKLERDVVRVSEVMDDVCTACKTARMPGDKFCTMHMAEISSLATESCKICSKYVDPALLKRGSDELEVVKELLDGYETIRYNRKYIDLIPEVQSNLVCGFKNERKNEVHDYAGFPGRIIKTEGEARVIDSPAFGGSKHISRVVSSVRNQRPEIRAATCITFNPAVRAALGKTGHSSIMLDNERDDDVLRAAITKNAGNSMDALVFEGSVGMEPLTYVLGTSVGDVIAKLVKILAYI